MIVTAVALLVLATIFLVIGILSSSVAWLVISLLATLAAAGTLVASFAHYRRRALIAPPAGYPGAYVAETPPPQPLPSTATAAAPVVAAPAATVLAGWDGRSAADCVRIVSTLSLDELHAVRRHEVEGKHRKTVLAAIDARIDEIVSVRRSYQTSS